MVEAFVAFGVLGCLPAGKHGDEVVGHADRVYHLVLGVSGVDVATLDGYFGRGGVEVLVFKLADGTAVHCVGEVAAEFLDIELVGAQTDLFVGVETDTDLAMLDLRMRLKVCHGCDDLGNAGLVVGAEKGGAVGNDQVVAHISG